MSRRSLPLLVVALVAGCSGGENESRQASPAAGPPAAGSTTRLPPTVPTAADVPRRYVHSAYASRLWSPRRRSDCGRIDLTAGAALYFSCLTSDGGLVPAAAARPLLPSEATPGAALRALLRGPSKGERRAGYASNFSAATAALPSSVRVNRGRRFAVVDLDPAVVDVEFAFVSVQDVAQIVSTVGQFPRIDWVIVLVGGRPLCEALGEC